MARSRQEMGLVGSQREKPTLGRMTPTAVLLAAVMECTGTGCKNKAHEVVDTAIQQGLEQHGTRRGIEGEGGVVDRLLYPAGTDLETDPGMLMSFHVVTAPRTHDASTLRVRLGTEIVQQTERYTPMEVDVADGALNTRSSIRLRTARLSTTALGEGAHLDLASRIDDLSIGRPMDRGEQVAQARSIWLNVRQVETPAGRAVGRGLSVEGQGETYEQAVAQALANIRTQTYTPAASTARMPRLTPPRTPGGRWENAGLVSGLDEGEMYLLTSLAPGRDGVIHREIVLEAIDGVERQGQPTQGVTVRVFYHDVVSATTSATSRPRH